HHEIDQGWADRAEQDHAVGDLARHLQAARAAGGYVDRHALADIDIAAARIEKLNHPMALALVIGHGFALEQSAADFDVFAHLIDARRRHPQRAARGVAGADAEHDTAR